MIQYNSLSECSVSSWNRSHFILFQHTSVGALPRAHPQPQLITASTTTQTTEVSTEKNTQLRSIDSAPPPHCGQWVHKATVLPYASEYPQEKKPSRKASAAQTKHKKELKEERMQKSNKSLATYKKKIKTMGFKSTPIPPLPPGTTSRANFPAVALTKDNAMNLDDEYGVEDFVAEIAAVSEDPNTDEDDRFEFHGFHRPMCTTRSKEEEDGMGEEGMEEDDSGPLYRMEALTSEADALMSSPSKALNNFLLSTSEGGEDDLEDLEETPIARKITVKGKAKAKEVVQVVGKGRYRKCKGDNHGQESKGSTPPSNDNSPQQW